MWITFWQLGQRCSTSLQESTQKGIQQQRKHLKDEQCVYFDLEYVVVIHILVLDIQISVTIIMGNSFWMRLTIFYLKKMTWSRWPFSENFRNLKKIVSMKIGIVTVTVQRSNVLLQITKE